MASAAASSIQASVQIVSHPDPFTAPHTARRISVTSSTSLSSLSADRDVSCPTLPRL